MSSTFEASNERAYSLGIPKDAVRAVTNGSATATLYIGVGDNTSPQVNTTTIAANATANITGPAFVFASTPAFVSVKDGASEFL